MPEFRLPEVRETLTITDGPYAGVEVEIDAGAPPLVRYTLIGLLEKPKGETAEQAIARGEELFALLADQVILGWNVADKRGKQIPVTAEGFVSVPYALLAAILAAYLGRDAR